MAKQTDLESQPIRKKTRPRPDGMKIERYKNLEKWSYRKWAWAFLRRNTKFKAACDVADNGSENDRGEVAKLFGLKRYKSYKEVYGKGKAAPKFTFGSITTWSGIKDDGRRSRKIPISYGQVVIRFDIASAATNS